MDPQDLITLIAGIVYAYGDESGAVRQLTLTNEQYNVNLSGYELSFVEEEDDGGLAFVLEPTGEEA